MKTEIKVQFYYAESKTNGYGFAPIMCRIIVNRRANDISTKIFIAPSQWQDNRVIGHTEKIIKLNETLSEIENQIYAIAQEMEVKGQKVTSVLIKEQYKQQKPIITRAEYFDGATSYLRTGLKELAPLNESKTTKKASKHKNLLSSKISVDDAHKIVRMNQTFIQDFAAYKQFRKFLRENSLKFGTLQSATGPVIVTTFSRIKLVFSFDSEYDYVAVQRVADNGYTTKTGDFYRRISNYTFPAPNVYSMLTKMIKFEIVSVDIIKSLKF